MRSPPLARCSARAALAPLQRAALLLLLGCPQLLDDQFHAPRPDAGADGGDDPTPAASLTPRVIDSRPAANERGVSRETRIELTFSEPMAAAATLAAYRSADLPVGDVDFAWREGGRVLVIEPRAPLEYASGAQPDSVRARTYSIELAAGARTASGRALEPFALSFSTAREIVASFPATLDAALTGKYRSDGSAGVGECELTQQTLCAGVGAGVGNPSYIGFSTFDVALPGERSGLTLAELSLTISAVVGTPAASLGPLLLESVRFDAIGAAAAAAAPRGPATTLTTSAELAETPSAGVLPALEADLAEGTRSQFRLRFAGAVSLDGGPDVIISDWPTLALRVGYLVP